MHIVFVWNGFVWKRSVLLRAARDMSNTYNYIIAALVLIPEHVQNERIYISWFKMKNLREIEWVKTKQIDPRNDSEMNAHAAFCRLHAPLPCMEFTMLCH